MQVVIIDDEQINLIVMRKMLGAIENCDAVEFNNAKAGLEWCQLNDPDLIIVDYMMPELDGMEFIRRLRTNETCKNTPVLMVTADMDKQVRYNSLREGANDFLNKPVDKLEFQARVSNMLHVRRSHLMLANRADALEREVQQRTKLIRDRERETIVKLARAAEFRDPETGAHILRMAHYSRLIANRLGMRQNFCDTLLEAAPMHDVGKLGTPDQILLKPARLTPEEFEIMKQHATIGYEILRDSASPVLQMGAIIAWTHHEKFDATGYPRGLKGEDIPLEGRIVAVADVFDALTSERPYKKPWTHEAAVEYLVEQRGKHLDPSCVDAFLSAPESIREIKNQYQDE